MGNSSSSEEKDFRDFKELIKTPKVFDRIEAILKENMCPENGDFLKEYFKAKKFNLSEMVELGMMTEEEKKRNEHTLVTQIFDKFIKNGAAEELNLPATIVNEFLEKYNSNNFDLSILEPIAKEVLMMIYSNNYPTYVRMYGEEIKRKKSQTGGSFSSRKSASSVKDSLYGVRMETNMSQIEHSIEEAPST